MEDSEASEIESGLQDRLPIPQGAADSPLPRERPPLKPIQAGMLPGSQKGGPPSTRVERRIVRRPSWRELHQPGRRGGL